MPGVGRTALPGARAHFAELLRRDVEDRRIDGGLAAERAARRRADAPAVAEEHARRIEDLDVQLPLEALQGPEHPVDAAPRLFALLVRGDDEEAPFAELARPLDGHSVSGPLVEERVHL